MHYSFLKILTHCELIHRGQYCFVCLAVEKMIWPFCTCCSDWYSWNLWNVNVNRVWVHYWCPRRLIFAGRVLNVFASHLGLYHPGPRAWFLDRIGLNFVQCSNFLHLFGICLKVAWNFLEKSYIFWGFLNKIDWYVLEIWFLVWWIRPEKFFRKKNIFKYLSIVPT